MTWHGGGERGKDATRGKFYTQKSSGWEAQPSTASCLSGGHQGNTGIYSLGSRGKTRPKGADGARIPPTAWKNFLKSSVASLTAKIPGLAGSGPTFSPSQPLTLHPWAAPSLPFQAFDPGVHSWIPSLLVPTVCSHLFPGTRSEALLSKPTPQSLEELHKCLLLFLIIFFLFECSWHAMLH